MSRRRKPQSRRPGFTRITPPGMFDRLATWNEARCNDCGQFPLEWREAWELLPGLTRFKAQAWVGPHTLIWSCPECGAEGALMNDPEALFGASGVKGSGWRRQR